MAATRVIRELRDLDDVDPSGMQDGSTLVYDEATAKHEYEQPAVAGSLTDLTDVTGTPGPNKAPVYDEHTGIAPLTAVPTQEDLDAILAVVVWHKVLALEAPWEPSNPTAVLTPDGVAFGPYADGSAAGGSLRYHGLDGQPFAAVRNLAYAMRYLDDEMVLLDAGASPYARVFTHDVDGNAHDAAFTPGSQHYRGLGPGPVQEFVATAGAWRYDDDAGTGGVPLAELQAAHPDDVITKITITLGFTAGANLVGLLRWWQINGDHFAFGAP
jgi:hypothetical protein